MLESKAKHYEILAGKIIDKLTLRNMEGYYTATKEEALGLIKEKFLTEGVSVAWGGSMTMEDGKDIGRTESNESKYCKCRLFYHEHQCHYPGWGTGEY